MALVLAPEDAFAFHLGAQITIIAAYARDTMTVSGHPQRRLVASNGHLGRNFIVVVGNRVGRVGLCGGEA